jgi:S-DNA-T family DNA segregation ATPase FtsK/SpoIIIE
MELKKNLVKESELRSILKSFRIGTSSVSLEEGEYFDVYSIVPSRGIRCSRIDSILSDIGLQLKSYSSPTGYLDMQDGSYKLKVQKREISTPPIEGLLDALPKDMFCPVLLGVDSYGLPIYCDMSKMPNMLIGGTTGSGKSVFLHNVVLSLAKNNAQIYLIDPKMVEFSSYKNVDCVEGIFNDYEECEFVLEMIKSEMNDRFSILSESECRSAAEYNKKNPDNIMRPIALVVDEWADIVLQDKKILKPLCAIAQKCRAAGISIILATQRPSVKVIPGILKANFPARVALRVSSSVDSRVILDKSGAENIKSVGEGIFVSPLEREDITFRTTYIEDIRDFIRRNNV